MTSSCSTRWTSRRTATSTCTRGAFYTLSVAYTLQNTGLILHRDIVAYCQHSSLRDFLMMANIAMQHGRDGITQLLCCKQFRKYSIYWVAQYVGSLSDVWCFVAEFVPS